MAKKDDAPATWRPVDGRLSFPAFLSAYGGLFDEKPSGSDYVRIAWIETPYGPMIAGADASALRFLDFADRRAIDAQIASLRRTSCMPLALSDGDVLALLRQQLDAYFSGSLRSFSVPVSAPGTPFQTLVWKALSEIPYGETRSYGELARSIGSPGASRAVGAANGVNRLLLVIPCHRVVNSDGSLGGFAGGIERKRALLELERAGMR
ncbi:MAG: hypothetical protein CVV47_00180 [Spirochaetae bacterium HGW-Spirochaetae-3]|jgi:AraC family transcriptional regulator of adaptative response/methylated-DNA-[protein]-cysteine methyltransferase|nr:MAG: hypothetical protein CVV47_00180 [Spirochaetae bacterium HGW-Spirochaetae-3]